MILFDAPPEFEVSYSKNIIEMVLFLSRFGNLLTLVVGNNGSGKTRLLNKLLSTVDDDCQVCHIKAQPLLSIDQLFQQVIESFAGENTFTGIPLTANQYEEWAEQLKAISGNRLLIIDDAEVLSTSVLHELCQLSAMQQAKETPHLHLILFGNYDLNVILKQSAQGVLDEDDIYVIDIPSLSESESKDWLEYLLSNLGIEFLPEQNILDDILQKGQGNLALLAESAEAFAAENQEIRTFDEKPEPWKRKISVVGYWFGSLTIIILLVLGLFFFQDEIAELTGIGSKKEPLIDRQQDIETVINVSEAETTSIPELDDDSPVINLEPITQKFDSQEANGEMLESNDEVAEVIVDDFNVTDSETTSNNTVEVIELKSELIPETNSELGTKDPLMDTMTSDEQFLISQPDTHHTVQLIGLGKESSVQAFIAKHNMPNMYYYRSTLNDKPWFIIILGSYANKNSALSARTNLPSELIKNGPWIKSLKAIKNEILAAQELTGE